MKINQIRSIVKNFIQQDDIDVVITTGGTGFTGRDVTPDAIEPLFEKTYGWIFINFSTKFHIKR